MIHFEAQALKGVGPFVQELFRFERGLSVVYGLNRTNTKSGKNSNGVGKSLFFGMLPEIIHELPMIGEKQDKMTTGGRHLFMRIDRPGGKRERVVIRRQGKKIGIEVDGVAKEHLTATKAREWIRQHIPVTEDEMRTYGYVDSRRPHPLVMGTSAERTAFFTRFFRLDEIDAERKIIKAALDSMKESRNLFNELRAQYDELKGTVVSAAELEVLRKRRAKGREILGRIQSVADAADQARQLVMFYDQSKSQIEHYIRAADAAGLEVRVGGFEAVYDAFREQAAKNRKLLGRARAFAEWQEREARYKKRLDDLSPITRKAMLHFKERLMGVASKRVKELREARADEELLLDRMRETLPQAKRSYKVIEQPKSDAAAVTNKLESLEHKLKHALKFGKGNCPTCGQTVKVDNPAAIKMQIKNAEAELRRHQAWNTYSKALADRDEARRSYEESKNRLEEVRAIIGQCAKFETIHKEIINLPEPPEPFEGRALELEVVQQMVEEDAERGRALDFLMNNQDTLDKVLVVDIEEVRDRLKASTSVVETVAKVNSQLSDIEVRIQLAEKNGKALASLRKRLRELQDELRDEEDLKELMKGYDPKAMKRMAIQAISSYLMNKVNQYARLVFPEDFHFSFVWEGAAVQLLAHIPPTRDKKNGEIIDVRKLSGAESKLFTMVLVLALLSFVPAERRLNLLILDEPTANFSEETFHSFKELLPVLLKIIPTIVIITPRTEELYGGAREFTVVKVDGLAAIKPGHPRSLGVQHGKMEARSGVRKPVRSLKSRQTART